MARRESDPGLRIALEFNKTTYKANHRQKLFFSLTNESSRVLRVLKWHTPLEGFKSNMFHVQGRSGRAAPYLGALYKRGAPRPEDYITLRPGQTVQHTLDFTDSYDMTEAGHYAVRYRKGLLDVGTDEPARMAKTFRALRLPGPIAVRSNTAIFRLTEPRKPKLRRGVVAGEAMRLTAPRKAGKAKAPAFGGCSSTQQATLQKALTAAVKMASAARDAVNDTPSWARHNAPRYREWFGAYDASRYDKIRTHYTKIADALANKDIKFICNLTGCDPTDYAFVFAGTPYEIHLCNSFWTAPLTGTDSQAGTLIHETSHFNVVASTDDHTYGQPSCRTMAKNHPDEAIDNADSHEYFAENHPAQSMQPPAGNIIKVKGNWPGMPASFSDSFDAALNGDGPFAGKCYFFKGSSFVRFDWNKDRADSGYPKSIAAGWHGLPSGFTSNFDAAINGQGPFKGKCYFFKGDSFIRYDWAADRADPGYPKKIAGNWNGFPSGFRRDFDAIINGGGPLAGKCYFFKGDSYIRYDWAADKVDAGFPKKIDANWNCLPAGYTGSYGAALEGGGPFKIRGYFFKGDSFIRYNWADDCAEA